MNIQTKKHNSPRHRARRFAMQALYQWHHTDHLPEEIFTHFSEEPEWDAADQKFFYDLVQGAIKNMTEIDALITPSLDRDLDDLNPVELAVLRLAVYEFKFRPDVPYKVVINEALELAKSYGSDQGYKYINGVLDAVAANLRSTEMNR
jgi:N utilization substance protein B